MKLFNAIICLVFFCVCSIADDGKNDFFEAIKQGDLATVKSFLESDPSLVKIIDQNGYTPLHWAGIRAQWSVYTLLLEYNPSVNAVGGDGGTPLHWTAHHDRADMVELLINKGANIDGQNRWGRAPMHVAARRGCLTVAELLLNKGADIQAATREGWTALHVAYKSGHRAMINLLVSKGASVTAKDSDGKTPAEHQFNRPQEVAIDPAKLNDYVGKYSLGGESFISIWREDDQLCIMEFAPDKLYSIGEDQFFCLQEPWKVSFKRNQAGQVESIDVDFLRRTVHGRKIDK